MDQKKGYITTIYSFYPFFQKEINIHSLKKHLISIYQSVGYVTTYLNKLVKLVTDQDVGYGI